MGAKLIKNYTKQGRGVAGFMLLEMTLALLIFSALMGIQMRKDFSDLLDLKAKNVAKNLVTLQGALNDTIATNYGQFNSLPSGVAPITIVGAGPGNSDVVIADGWKPTIANLVALGKLPSNFSAKSSAGGNYKILLDQKPVGCVAPNCNLEGIIVIDSPFIINGVIDDTRAGLALRNIGSDGAITSQELKTTLSGLNGQWSTPLPATITPARSLLAVRVGYSSSVWASFFRKDGSVQMTGDGNFGNHSLVNVKQVMSTLKAVDDVCLPADNGAIASGVINGNGTVMVCRNGLWKLQTGNTANLGDVCAPEGTTATSLSNNESLVCKNGKYSQLVKLLNDFSTIGAPCPVEGKVATNSVNSEQLVCQSGVYVPFVKLVKTASIGAACAPNNSLAQTVAGNSLICQAGTWIELAGRMGKFAYSASVTVSVTTTVQGVVVSAPVCEINGQPRIYLVSKSEEQIGFLNRYATGSGPWNVYAEDGVGAPVNAVMLAQTYCYYP